MKKAGVIGAGTMGHGIAELLALHDYDVTLVDTSKEALEIARKKILKSLERFSKKGAYHHIDFTEMLEKLEESDIVIEAVPENLGIKKAVLVRLGEIVTQDTIIASNTSTIPISTLAGFILNPERFLGTHFFNPPVMMPLVEVIRGSQTSADTLTKTYKLLENLGKEKVTLKKDVPGFIVNRINARLFSKTFSLLEEGISIEMIDAAAVRGLGFPMGMCQLLDFVGIDVILNGSKELQHNGFDIEISPILQKMVSENRLGMKTGGGFYNYSDRNRKIEIKKMNTGDLPLRLISPGINEAYWLLKNDISGCADIERAMVKGMNWPKGPVGYARQFGIPSVINQLETEFAKCGKPWYRADPAMATNLELLCS